jgi:hypothetical protein
VRGALELQRERERQWGVAALMTNSMSSRQEPGRCREKKMRGRVREREIQTEERPEGWGFWLGLRLGVFVAG